MNVALKWLRYFFALVAIGGKTNLLGWKRTLILGGAMLVQNMIFFMLWVLFFKAFGAVKGWTLADVSMLYGVVTLACGASLFFCDGARTLVFHVKEGSFDDFLMRPRHPLLPLLFSRSSAASLGDILSAPIYWFFIGDASIHHLPLLLILSVLSTIIFLSCVIIFFAIGFWSKGCGRFSDQLFEMLIIFSSIPQHAQSFGLQIVTFSILPAGFISLLPVRLIRSFDESLFLLFVALTVFYALSALSIFNAGVRRYRKA